MMLIERLKTLKLGGLPTQGLGLVTIISYYAPNGDLEKDCTAAIEKITSLETNILALRMVLATMADGSIPVTEMQKAAQSALNSIGN